MKILDLISHLSTIAAEHGNLEVLSDGFYDLRAPEIDTNQDIPADWNVPANFVRLRIND